MNVTPAFPIRTIQRTRKWLLQLQQPGVTDQWHWHCG